jgi:hypothetical protein
VDHGSKPDWRPCRQRLRATVQGGRVDHGDELLDRARHADRMGWRATRDHHLSAAAGHYRAAGREDLARTCERLIGRP